MKALLLVRIHFMAILVVSGCAAFILLLAACGPIPVQVSKTSQEQAQTQTASQTASTAADQQSAHQSESKQGTNSMPVIIICNSNNSPNSTCATPREGGALNDVVDSKLRKKVQ